MKNFIPAVLVFASTTFAQNIFVQNNESYLKVANRLVDLINAADYPAVENLFNKEMGKALPLHKATPFFDGMKAQFGTIQKLDKPKRSAGWTVFPAHFERGLIDMSLALDRDDKIAGLIFKPRAASPEAAPKMQQDMESYAMVANHLVQLINAADYSGIEKLFNKEMNEALPREKSIEFFAGLREKVGQIQKLDEPKRRAGGAVFAAYCERSLMSISLVLNDEKIAGVSFKPYDASSEAAPNKQITELSLPFKGRWLVFWGGDTKELNHHHDVPAQKFAFDIRGVDEKGQTHRGDGSKNEDYYCFGREILAPAAGVVVEAIDGVRDNTPGVMNSYCVVGNCVVIQHRTNEFSVLAHLQRGSVAVKAGDRVQREQLLGKCGNSGDSSEPHLHYHLQHSAIFQDALGIECVFDKVPLGHDGTAKLNYSPVKGDVINVQ